MHKIFWTQADNADNPNWMIIDDVKEAYRESEEQQKAMGKLIDVRTWACLPVIAEQREKFSKAFHVAIKENEGVTIRSFFQSNEGLAIPYTYYSEFTDLSVAIDDLNKYAALIGRKLIESDFETLQNEIDTYNPKEQDRERENLRQIGGGFERIWQHIRRH